MILPTDGEIDQVTPVFVVPLTLALNFCDWLALRETDVGDTEIVTCGAGATRPTLADAVLLVSATLRAVTITAWELMMVAGAV